MRRLISVPHDENSLCRAEVCFGQSGASALGFTLRAKPRIKEKLQKPRFGVGDRVACAVEDDSGDFTLWAAGKVTDVNYDVERDTMLLDRELGLSWDWTRQSGVVHAAVGVQRVRQPGHWRNDAGRSETVAFVGFWALAQRPPRPPTSPRPQRLYASGSSPLPHACSSCHRQPRRHLPIVSSQRSAG